MLGYASDYIKVEWYPAEFYIIEQGEPPSSLYLILSGHADVIEEQPDGSLVKVNEVASGQFIGEMAFAEGKKRNAHVIALDNVTCLVFSPSTPTTFAGRGEDAQHLVTGAEFIKDNENIATTCIDVTDHVVQKVAAIVEHRTQYPIPTDMFPESMWQEILENEYFIRVYPPIETETELLA